MPDNPPQPETAAANQPSFERAMARLESIVDKLEHGDTTLEESILLFEQGSQLAEECRRQIEEAEGKIEVLVRQRNGRMKAERFDS